MLKWCLVLSMLLSSMAFAYDKIIHKNDSQATNEKCVKCHNSATPGIVKQYLDSPMTKLAKKPVLCVNCHSFEHQTADDAEKATLPTADSCAEECHNEQLVQMREGKHNLAWFGMKSQVAYHGQPAPITGEGYRGCSGCHKIGQKGLMGIQQGFTDELESDGGKEISEYRYGNAQCDACHTRHSFKKSEAQDPRACSNCHMGFDHPQWEMYKSSKHGIIWDIEKNKNEDNRTPTCQQCHMAEGNHAVRTSWGFLGLRIPTKQNVLGLIKIIPDQEESLNKLAKLLPDGNYEGLDDDPQWVFDRTLILQAAGILDSEFQPTERFIEIIVQSEAANGPSKFNEMRSEMKAICNNCHTRGYIAEHFDASDSIIKSADHEFAKAIQAVQGLYKDGILQKPEGWKYAPDLLQYYDAKTKIEQELYLIMLKYRQRAFQGAFHASNDYMHWYGWAPLKSSVNVILEEVKHMRAATKTVEAKK
ncbi:multiheme c-type cytochrome [Candidatus Halobeggiatoa sp. HSG11]|nr:multiheme c-type cytochrome [Candidatus Halobeggiatoa sp. HSG11]